MGRVRGRNKKGTEEHAMRGVWTSAAVKEKCAGRTAIFDKLISADVSRKFKTKSSEFEFLSVSGCFSNYCFKKPC